MIIQNLAQNIEHYWLTGRGRDNTSLPGLVIYRTTTPSQIDATIYEPIVCLIVQGEKQTTIGDKTWRLQQGQCIVVGHHLPVMSQVTMASERSPYLSLVISLDLNLLRTLDDRLHDFDGTSEDPRSLEVATISAPLIDVLGRYLALMDDPVEANILLPLVRKELHFRLLRSESGAMLRALANRESHASNIARAIEQLRARFRENLDMTELAKSAGMSASSFHRHFKSMTTTTPLQYQKDLRLTEARRLLRTQENSVSGAAFEVGYESASQFSREYSRKFGVSPRADLQVA